MYSSYSSYMSRDRQHGMVLVTTLVMLFVMAMLMISAMRTNVAEERMAGNARDWQTAFQAAESALRDAERDILGARISGKTGFVTGCSATGLCLPETDGTSTWQSLATDPGWVSGANTGTKTVKYGTYTGSAALMASDGTTQLTQPRYIIEVLSVPQSGSIKKGPGGPSYDYLYRVTAVGFGVNTNTRVMLQGVYRQH